MHAHSYALLEQFTSTMEEVVGILVNQESSSEWAGKTNPLAAQYVKHLTDTYGDNWSKGLLSENLLGEILLPAHSHTLNGDSDPLIFPLDTRIKNALEQCKEKDPEVSKECLEHIRYLKEEIKEKGFTSSIILAVIDNSLKHVDGLHRLIALHWAMEEGYEYKPVQTYLINAGNPSHEQSIPSHIS